jgi:AcrR family transcriptional regulator
MMPNSRTPSLLIAPEVLNAAVAILDDEGLDGFTVRAVAKRANVAPMAIYNHFGGVNGVIEELWNRGFEMLRVAITRHSGDVEGDFLSAGLAYRRFALENRGLYRIMFLQTFRNFEPSPASAQVAARTFQALVAIVERCQAAGLFVHSRPSDAAQVIWASCHGYVSLDMHSVNFASDADDAYLMLLETLRRGLR